MTEKYTPGAPVGRMIFFLICFTLLLTYQGRAAELGKMAVLPFQIHTREDQPGLEEKLQGMFISQCTARGFGRIDPQAVNRYIRSLKREATIEDLSALGKELGADYVLAGSLTQVGNKISLDVKTYDMAGIRPPLVVYVIEDHLDKLQDAVNKAVKSILDGLAGVERIDSIKVKGNRRVETEAILAVITSRAGETLDRDRLDEDLKSIYTMGFFKDVNIETEDAPHGKIVIFNVVEKPSIGSIVFKGNKKVKTDKLRGEVGIKPYAILNLGEVKQAVNRLKEYYRLQGFYHAQIEEKIEEKSDNEVVLTFQIDEEKKIYIKKIVFKGNDHFKDSKLLDVMLTKKKGLFSFFTDSGLLDKKKLEYDVSQLNAFYHNHGFIRVKIGEPQVVYEEDFGLKIIIDIIEGPQYMIHEVNIAGDLVLPVEELQKKINIKKEKFFNREVVRQDVQALEGLYMDEGYAYADVVPSVTENDEQKWVDVNYRVSQGEKVRFERINIAGNTNTRDKVIRRELKVVEGEYFSGKGMAKSRRNINRLGFFDDVEVQTKKGSSDDLMIMDVKVKERPTGSVNFGVGYSDYDKTTGKVQVQENNLFGRGQALSTSAQFGKYSTQYDIQFTEPWLFDKHLSTSVGVYKTKEEYDEYTKNGMGGSLGFGFPIEDIDEYTFGSVRYGFDSSDLWEDVVHYEVVDVSVPGPPPSVISTLTPVVTRELHHYDTSKMTLGLSRDSKDHPWFPRHGSLNAFSYEYAGGLMGGDVAYDKWNLRTQWFFPLAWETAFMAQGRWGLIHKRPDDGVLPIYEKFRLGGINSVRGFKTNRISPVDPITKRRIGGEKMMVYNLEYRFPLYKKQGVTGLVFFDAGNVFTADQSYTFSGIKMTYGAGIRWLSAFPIYLVYGKVINPKTDEPTGSWDFTIGGAF